MRRAYKFRLRPNKAQQIALAQSLETHRRVYNQALAERRDAYRDRGETLTYYDQRPRFAALRNAAIAAQKRGDPGPHWLAQVAAASVRDTIKRLDRAFQAFFRRLREGQKPGYPRFRGRDRYDSIPFDNYNSGSALVDSSGRVVTGETDDDLHGYKLRLFGVGAVRIRMHRHIQGKIKTVTVKREADHWYVVFSCDLGEVNITPSTAAPVGVDVGLEAFLTTSDGHREPNPRYLKKELRALKRLNRKIALHEGQKKRAGREYAKRGSKRRQKAKAKLARLHRRISNLRKEHQHQVAGRLVHRYGLVALESLNIRGMLGHPRLARAIADAAWGGFVNTLKSKAEYAGVKVVEVDPRGTSQECSGCGAQVRKDLKQRQHNCPTCGLSLHRDENAARVILARALARTGPAEPNGKGSSARAPRTVLAAQTVSRPREGGRKQREKQALEGYLSQYVYQRPAPSVVKPPGGAKQSGR
jgi:putative transposase